MRDHPGKRVDSHHRKVIGGRGNDEEVAGHQQVLIDRTQAGVHVNQHIVGLILIRSPFDQGGNRPWQVLERLNRPGKFLGNAQGDFVFGQPDIPRKQEQTLPPFHSGTFNGRQGNWPGFKSRGQAGLQVVPLSFLIQLLDFLVTTLEIQHQPGQVALGVGVNQNHLFAFGRQHPAQMKGRSSLAHAALVVEQGNFLSHGAPPYANLP